MGVPLSLIVSWVVMCLLKPQAAALVLDFGLLRSFKEYLNTDFTTEVKSLHAYTSVEQDNCSAPSQRSIAELHLLFLTFKALRISQRLATSIRFSTDS